jgi:hypothetical protein
MEINGVFEGADEIISVPVRDDLDFDATSRHASEVFARAYSTASDQPMAVRTA